LSHDEIKTKDANGQNVNFEDEENTDYEQTVETVPTGKILLFESARRNFGEKYYIHLNIN
jgi:hypothetical protein